MTYAQIIDKKLGVLKMTINKNMIIIILKMNLI